MQCWYCYNCYFMESSLIGLKLQEDTLNLQGSYCDIKTMLVQPMAEKFCYRKLGFE